LYTLHSILVESLLETGSKEYDLKSLRVLCSNYYFNSSINSQRVTELREQVIYALRQLALALFDSYKKHTFLLNTTPLLHYTKLGLLCFITGSLQNHLDNIDSFFSQLQTMMKSHGIYATNPNFLSLTELTQFIQESQLVFRAMKHVESIVIKEKSFQRDQNLAVQYYIEKFVLSTTTKATTAASAAHHHRQSPHHKYYYCLPKEFILFNLSMDSTRKNLFSSFQVYQGKYVEESLNEKHPVKKITPYFHQVLKELNFLMKSVEEESKSKNNNNEETSTSQKAGPRSVKSSPIVSSRTVTEKKTSICSSHRPVGDFRPVTPKDPPRSSSITSINRSLEISTSSNSAIIKEFLLYDYFPFFFLMCGRTILAKTLFSKLQEILGQKLFHKLDEGNEFPKQLLEYLSLLLFYAVWALEDIEKNNNDRSNKLAVTVDSKLTLEARFLHLSEFSLVNYELLTSDRAYQKKQMTQLLQKYYSVRRKLNAFSWKMACDFICMDSEEFLSSLPDFHQQF
jgi:hypothetical protein